MPKIDITGTQGEVNFAGKGGKITRGSASMDEIVVAVTREGKLPIALAFEDAFDMNLFTLDLSLDQADEFARTLLQTVESERARISGRPA